MKNVAIIYFSGTDHTHQMAQAIAEGVGRVGDCEAQLLRIMGEQIHHGRWSDDGYMDVLSQADAIVFGTPTYMGGPSAQFKAFADRSSEAWFQRLWQDKLAGGFTHGAGLSGEKTATLVYLSILAAQHGMTWINPSETGFEMRGQPVAVNRLGSSLGPMGQSDMNMEDPRTPIDEGDRLTCINYGMRIAEWAQRCG